MSTHLLEEEPINEQLQSEYEIQILTMLIGGDNKEKKEHIYNHLTAEMFTKTNNRKIFKAIEKLHKENKEIEIGNVCECLTVEEQKKYCIALDKEYITNMNCDYYLEKLLNVYIKKLLKSCDSFEGYKKVEKIKQKYTVKKIVRPISYAADELILEYINKWGNEVKTYYPQIDKKIGSLQSGDILILAGATGMGKTCMELNLILNMAAHGKKVLFFSLEMPLRQLQNRMISTLTGINSDKMRKFTMTDEEFQKYSDYALSKTFADLKIDVCTEFDITIDEIKEIVKSVDPDVIFIDYLGLIKSETSGTIYEKTSEISRRLKLVANETNKPFVVLHQLSRIPYERKQKRPLLSDLRDSGKIEQDADCICFVYRESYYNPSANPSKMEFIISKSRHTGGRCIIDLNYNAEKQLITDTIGEWMEKSQQCSLGV